MQAVIEQRTFAAQLAESVVNRTRTPSAEDQREALLALSEKREADAEHRTIAFAKKLLHSASWRGMAESTRFVAMEDEYYATGKIPLMFLLRKMKVRICFLVKADALRRHPV
jgi:hypothetical protein